MHCGEEYSVLKVKILKFSGSESPCRQSKPFQLQFYASPYPQTCRKFIYSLQINRKANLHEFRLVNFSHKNNECLKVIEQINKN